MMLETSVYTRLLRGFCKRFPKNGGTPGSNRFKDKFSIIKHPAMGVPPWPWKLPFRPPWLGRDFPVVAWCAQTASQEGLLGIGDSHARQRQILGFVTNSTNPQRDGKAIIRILRTIFFEVWHPSRAWMWCLVHLNLLCQKKQSGILVARNEPPQPVVVHVIWLVVLFIYPVMLGSSN